MLHNCKLIKNNNYKKNNKKKKNPSSTWVTRKASTSISIATAKSLPFSIYKGSRIKQKITQEFSKTCCVYKLKFFYCLLFKKII